MMQNNSARQDESDAAGNRGAADNEVNDRLVEILKANAIKADRPAAIANRRSQPGFFAEAYAVIGLVGLMIVAYVYTLFVGNKA